jgi:hypothetical protein
MCDTIVIEQNCKKNGFRQAFYTRVYVRTSMHWACMVGFGPFSLNVIHKEGLCPSSGDINRLMMISSYCAYARATFRASKSERAYTALFRRLRLY